MTSLEQHTTQFLQNIKSDIVANQNFKDARGRCLSASGRSADSLKETTRETESTVEGDLHGASYFYFQIHGRKPGKPPPLKSIEQWIVDKKIDLGEKTLKQLAYIFRSKIAQQGTDIYIKKRPGLAFERIIDIRKQAFVIDITKALRSQFISQLQKSV